MPDSLLKRLKVLEKRLERIVKEVKRNPASQASLAAEMEDIHSEMERLIETTLPADQRDAWLSTRARARGELH